MNSTALLHIWANNAAAHAHSLSAIDLTWRTETHRVGDGWLVLSGVGLYVNRLLGAGVQAEVSDGDLDLVESRSQALGVPAAVEVTKLTQRAVLDRLVDRGFSPNVDAEVTGLVRALHGPEVVAPRDFVVRSVDSQHDLGVWQETSALGWGHVGVQARRASDAFASAARCVDQEGMMIAFDSSGLRPVGCASMTISDGLATLGAMSTVPACRHQGVQAVLLRRRLELAIERECDIAASTAIAGSASERNLLRHGFVPVCTITTWTKAAER